MRVPLPAPLVRDRLLPWWEVRAAALAAALEGVGSASPNSADGSGTVEVDGRRATLAEAVEAAERALAMCDRLAAELRESGS